MGPRHHTGPKESVYSCLFPQAINLSCKFELKMRLTSLMIFTLFMTGMVTEADLENWKPSDFKAHVDHVIKQFGIDRVMFGSDWPVCKLANANLPDVYKLLNDLLKDLSDADKRKVFVENARKFYNLSL